MKVAIFGAGKAGCFLYDEIKQKAKDIEVLSFIDNHITGKYDDVEILLPNVFFKMFAEEIEAIFIAAGAQKTVKIMIDTIRQNSKCDIYMLHDIAGKCRISPFDCNGKILNRRLRKIRFCDEKPTLPYFEVPITDKCNLNCKGCLFACNALEGNEHVEKEQIINDAKRMSELFYDVPWIRILGGEPLMHPDMKEILITYRKYFPDSEIDLCTNGLLIPKLSEDVFQCLSDNLITVHVSGYKPTYNMLNQIDDILKKHKLDYTVLKRETFAKYYTEEPCNDAQKSFYNCIASGCRELYKGKLLRCSAVIAFEKFNNQFGTNYIIKENEDWFDIHNPLVNAWDIKEKIDKCSSVCHYCNVEKMEEFEWDYAGNKVSIKDYII